MQFHHNADRPGLRARDRSCRNLSPGTYSVVVYTPPTYTSTDGPFNGQQYHNLGGNFLSPTGTAYPTGTGAGQVNPTWYGNLTEDAIDQILATHPASDNLISAVVTEASTKLVRAEPASVFIPC